MNIKTLEQEEKFETITDRLKDLGMSKEKALQEMAFAIELAKSNKQLSNCSAVDIFNCIIELASLGLSLNPAKRLCYLVPFYDRHRKESVPKLMPSYMGLEKILTDSKAVQHIACHVVWEGDEIEMDLADEQQPIKRHTPYITIGQQKGSLVMVYSVATLASGVKIVEYMSREEIDHIRDTYSKSKDVWKASYTEMARKTVIKRHTKHLPKSLYTERVYKAIDLDNQVTGQVEVGYKKLGYLEKLLGTSGFDPEKKARLEREIADIQYDFEYKGMLHYLQDNQVESDKDKFERMIKDE
ncbi:MAG: recombinase RecT [Thermonemataceae bacterium]